MKAAWIICKTIFNETIITADLPDVPYRARFAGDIRTFGPDPAPADHKHALRVGLALQSDHYHNVFITPAGTVLQEYAGPGAAAHDHVIPEVQTHLLGFVLVRDQDAAALINHPGVVPVGEAAVTGMDNGFYWLAPLSAAAWDAATVTLWQTRLANFGLTLPAPINSDHRLATYLLALFTAEAQTIRAEQFYRPNKIKFPGG